MPTASKIHCIACGEQYYRQEPTCPACGEANPTLRPSPPAERERQDPPQVSSPGLALLGILLPVIGIIVGLIYLLSDDDLAKAKGKRALQWSLMGILIGVILWGALTFFISLSEPY